MPQPKLSLDHVDFIMKMKKVKYSNCEIARRLGVSEGAIRYRIKREGKEDGRKSRPSVVDAYRDVIDQWRRDYEGVRRRPTLLTLYEWLRDQYDFSGSYDAFRRYIRKHFPEFHKKGKRIRIETPPGVLLFSDWKEDLMVQIGRPGAWVEVHALCFTLGFSRKSAVCFTERKDLPAFIHSHQEAFREFGGLPEFIRTDCLKSAVVKWRGRASVLNDRYKRFLGGVGVECFPARPGTPEDKGKGEKRILDLFSRMDFKHCVYKDMADLKRQTNKELSRFEREWRCGATGLSVEESFAYERKYLKPLPDHFPVIPLQEKRARVRRDGLVFFKGNYYQVHSAYRDKTVLCMNTGEEIVIYHNGEEIKRFPNLPGTRGMVRLSEEVMEDPTLILSDTVRQWGLEVARRQVLIYQDIIRRRNA